MISLFELAARRKFITALGPFGAKAVCAPRHRRLGARLLPGHGETGVVYVTERDGGGGQQAGGSSWWGPQPGFPTASAALKPPTRGHCRRGRGTIRSGCCLAVRAALPAARVDGLRAEGYLSFLFPCPVSLFPAREIITQRYQSRTPLPCATSAMMMMDP